MPSIAEYQNLPRFGQTHASRERISGVGPCVEIFSKYGWFTEESYARHMTAPHTAGMKLFDNDDNIKFLLNLQPNSGYYLALSQRAISVFYSYDGQATEKLCDNNDEIIGHGVVEEIQYKKEVSRAVTMNFKILVVFKSGIIRRLTIEIASKYPNFQMKIKNMTENKSAAGNLIAAPLMDKSDIVLIYEDTIVKGDGTVCRGTPAEGRQVIFSAGGFPWKSKIFLVTDDGEAHYAKMTGKVGDGKIALFGSGRTTCSSSGLKIKQPTCACLWDKREIVVGNENGDMYRLDKKDFKLLDEYEMEYGPLTFLQSHGHELWIGSKEGIIQNYDEIC